MEPTLPTPDEEQRVADPLDLRGVVVEYTDDPDELTVFPADADETDLVTRWITADEGSFVDLADMR